jgi:glyoxylase-like metal-dependent hydrolase (beta-lactamase superfamily II)
VADRSGPWIEIADRVFTRRYRFFDQQVGVVLGGRDVLLIDTRISEVQGREIRDDLRELTRDPVSIVVNTHWHHDHTFGNHVFRPVAIWGHERCPIGMRRDGERMRAALIAGLPEMAADFAEVTIDPPEHVFGEHAEIEVGDRRVDLRYLGLGHTDSDIVIEVPGTGVVFAGDLIENGATPAFQDSYPLDWPETVSRLAERIHGAVVPGHGEVADRAFVDAQLAAFLEIARLGREVHAGALTLDDAIGASPFDPETSREPLERTLAQLRGELG